MKVKQFKLSTIMTVTTVKLLNKKKNAKAGYMRHVLHITVMTVKIPI